MPLKKGVFFMLKSIKNKAKISKKAKTMKKPQKTAEKLKKSA